MNKRHTRRGGGFSIIELLVAIIIIGILVAIIVPRLSERSEQAKRARAEQDLELIQKAQEQAVIDTSFMVKLYVLDDTRGGDSVGNSIPNNVNDVVDSFRDEGLNSIYSGISVNAPRLFIDPQAQIISPTDRVVRDVIAAEIFQRLALPANETNFGWRGPYITYQVDVNNGNPNGNGSARTYIGDDPWGNDYIMFTPEGMVDDLWDPASGNAGTGEVVATKTIGSVAYDCVVFDRFVVLSLGPNGVPGDGATPRFGSGDDIYREF
jgi:prepilin-type N-terminal cleavage/methylation domain-containing protein